MSNRKELRKARRKVEEAVSSLAGIESLPRRVGQTVDWPNRVRWVRVGDDAWEPRHEGNNYERLPEYDRYFGTYSSAHVAWGIGATTMSDDEARAVIRRAIGGVLFNVMNFPSVVQARLLGQDMSPLATKITDAVLAALPSRDVQVTDDADDAAWEYSAWLDGRLKRQDIGPEGVARYLAKGFEIRRRPRPEAPVFFAASRITPQEDEER